MVVNLQRIFAMKLTAKVLFTLLLSSLGLGIYFIFDGQASDAESTSGSFIVNKLSGKCIDVAGAPGRDNAAPLQLFDCESSGRNRDNDSETDQKWTITSDGFIKNSLSGRCIDVAGAPGEGNAEKLQLFDCESSGRNRDNDSETDQRWTITGDGFIKNKLSGRCIDVAGAPGKGNAAPLQLFDCELSGRNRDNGSQTDQQWDLTSTPVPKY